MQTQPATYPYYYFTGNTRYFFLRDARRTADNLRKHLPEKTFTVTKIRRRFYIIEWGFPQPR